MARAQRNLAGLTENFDGIRVHKNYLNELGPEEFASGLNALAEALKALYSGMVECPQHYAMKDANDIKGLVKHTNFLLLLAQKGEIKGDSLEVDGKNFAAALKEAKVTKPEIYFASYEPLGFVFTGLGKKIEASEKITVEFPDNKFLMTAWKAMADAAGTCQGINPNQGNWYFESLDPRILADHPATEPKLTMEYILSKLSGEGRDVVAMFHAFISPLAKCDIKGNIGWYWTPTFTLKSTKKVILSFKLDLESYSVKLNLANIGKYPELLNALSAKLMREITEGGWDCANCNPKCEGAFSFTINGIPYRKCRGGSFVFADPDPADSKLLLGLLQNELQFSQ